MRFEFVPQDYHMKLENIGSVAVDAKDNVYVAVRGGSVPLVVFDRDGRYLRHMGGELNVRNAHDVHVDRDQNVFLLDGARHVVYKLDPDGKLIMTLGTLDRPAEDSGAINGDYKTVRRAGSPFNAPTKVTTAPGGDIYVADGYGNCCVHRFSAKGEHILSWGAPGDAPGALQIPHGICVEEQNGNVYVADRENFRIQIFSREGKLLNIWEDIHRPTDVCISGDYVYVSELGTLLFTDNITYDYRTRREHSKIRVFDKTGKEQARIGTADGGQAGSFFAVHGMCVDSEGCVWAAEVNNWDYASFFTAWPGGVGMPTGRHAGLQKFRTV